MGNWLASDWAIVVKVQCVGEMQTEWQQTWVKCWKWEELRTPLRMMISSQMHLRVSTEISEVVADGGESTVVWSVENNVSEDVNMSTS